MIEAMSIFANRAGLGLAVLALVLITGGALLWARYGTLVYFDTIAAAFVGCLI